MIDLLKSYRWGELWNYLQKKEIINREELAIKSMLLSGWWEDHGNSRETVQVFALDDFLEPLVFFGAAYTALAVGDPDLYAQVIKKRPKNTPKWIDAWLNIEYLCRSLQFEKLRLYFKSEFRDNSLDCYVFTALIQGLDHEWSNNKNLLQWLTKLKTVPQSEHLKIILLMKNGLVEIKPGMHPMQKKLYALHQIKKRNVESSVAELEVLAKSYGMDIDSLNLWLGFAISLRPYREKYQEIISFAFSMAPPETEAYGVVASYALIYFWSKGDYENAHKVAAEIYPFIKGFRLKKTRNNRIYIGYIILLCSFWQKNRSLFRESVESSDLVAIGDSHSLVFSNLLVSLGGKKLIGETAIVIGVKMYHLSNPSSSYHESIFRAQLQRLLSKDNILFAVGEIDTRPDEGIWKNSYRINIPYEKVVESTVDGYIDYIRRNTFECAGNIIIQGVPAPAYGLKDMMSSSEEDFFLQMIYCTNERLKEKSLANNMWFIDIYAATVNKERRNNGLWSLDGYHVSPAFYAQMDQWIVKKS